MNRLHGFGLIAAAGGIAAALSMSACGGDDSNGGSDCALGQVCGSGGGMGAGGMQGGGGGPGSTPYVCGGDAMLPVCEASGACFPAKTAAACYGASANGIGDECFAKRDQSKGSANDRRLQWRLTWARSTKPPGNTDPVVYQVLGTGANLPQAAECNQSGLGVFQQLLDIDLTDTNEANNRVYSGWAQNVADATESADAIANGLCMVTDSYDNPAYNLPQDQMSPTTGWPDGLPPPMGRGARDSAGTPWEVKPAVLKRRPTAMGDFNVATDRNALIAEVAADPSVNGITYIDEGTGYSHSYVTQTWVIVTLGAPIAIPIREVETTYQINDPNERGCMGAYRGQALIPPDCLSPSDPQNPEWGWYQDKGAKGTAPAQAVGYFLITELEQVYSATLGKTLCVSYPGNEADGTTPKVQSEGFYDPAKNSCVTAKWDPSKADGSGLPKGDWCSATNGPATETCHDAWRSETWQTFQAFPVKPQGTACPIAG